MKILIKCRCWCKVTHKEKFKYRNWYRKNAIKTIICNNFLRILLLVHYIGVYSFLSKRSLLFLPCKSNVIPQSSTPSHSVGANVQRVLSLMKSHNMALCASHTPSPRSTSPSDTSSSDSLDQDMADLLLQLQDEFGQMSL